MRDRGSPFRPKSPFGSSDLRWLFNYDEDLLADPPEISFDSKEALDGVWRFRSSAAFPPFVGPDIASGTFPIVAGLNLQTFDLSAHPDETGRLFIAGEDANAKFSNWLRSSEFTTPAAASPDITVVQSGITATSANATSHTFGARTFGTGDVILVLGHYRSGTPAATSYVRINGVNMTQIGASITQSSGYHISFWKPEGLTGGTYDITTGYDNTVIEVFAAHWVTENVDFATANVQSQVGSSATARSTSANVSAGGAIFSGCIVNSSFTDLDFTAGVAEILTSGGTDARRLAGHALFPSAVTPQIVTATGTGTAAHMVLGSLYIGPVV